MVRTLIVLFALTVVSQATRMATISLDNATSDESGEAKGWEKSCCCCPDLHGKDGVPNYELSSALRDTEKQCNYYGGLINIDDGLNSATAKCGDPSEPVAMESCNLGTPCSPINTGD